MKKLVQEIQISPADLVARTTATASQEHGLLLVTGDSGVGKTTWCLELLQRARAAGLEAVGLISPAVFEQGTKIAIDLINVANGERRRLAVKRSETNSSHKRDTDALEWVFNVETLAWGNQVLEEPGAGQLLILDEMGPLELLEKRGLVVGIDLINRQGFPLTCAVVRPKLLATALECWPWARVLDLTKHPMEAKRP